MKARADFIMTLHGITSKVAARLPSGRLFAIARKYLRGTCIKKMPDGILYDLDVYEWTQYSMAKSIYTEPMTLARIKSILGVGDVFIDVGAHIGSIGLVARKCIGESGLVISVEPQPYNCEKILVNWELNNFKNNVLYVGASGANDGSVCLSQQSASDKARLSLSPEIVKPNDLDLKFMVPLYKLSTIIKEQKLAKVKLIKIDVEGYEIEVIKGLESSIDAVENIIFECLDSSGGFQKTKEICDYLIERGFQITDINGKEWMRNENALITESNLVASRI